MAARVVVTASLPAHALRLLGAHEADVWVAPRDTMLRPATLRQRARGATALVTLLHDKVDAELLDAAGPQLKVVANVGVGFDNIDLAQCRRRGVVVTNTPGVLVDATADLTLALLLGVTRRIGEADRLVRSGASWRWSMDLLLGQELRGRVLGIVGFGAIGQAVARRALAFGMVIVYFQRHPVAATVEAELGCARLVSLDRLLAESDVITLHCPLTPETRHLIGEQALACMRPSAVLVNTARGPLVDERALATALRQGVIAGAGLDVYEDEPAVRPELFGLDNVLLLPHIGSATAETRTRMAVMAVRNVVAVLDGEAALTPI